MLIYKHGCVEGYYTNWPIGQPWSSVQFIVILQVTKFLTYYTYVKCYVFHIPKTIFIMKAMHKEMEIHYRIWFDEFLILYKLQYMIWYFCHVISCTFLFTDYWAKVTFKVAFQFKHCVMISSGRQCGKAGVNLIILTLKSWKLTFVSQTVFQVQSPADERLDGDLQASTLG